MSGPAIRIERLGKAYQIGLGEAAYPTFREALVRQLTAPWRRFRELSGRTRRADEWFWALRDVSFDVPPGEVVGIIGRNGAGKSTLLKILSRITEPTEGQAELRGRVASLLEVGTGFHPELTGRENIYMNGAILGMRKAEIDRKFDDIVAFAEIEKFLDTPVKRYSSGMYVRLAFAVAAHLEPEILVVDEVLAVGDHEFQRKCLGKMREVAAGDGRTVLFVSHNMPAVRSLCRHGVLLERGRIQRLGPAEDCVAEYLKASSGGALQACVRFRRPGGAPIWMDSATLLCGGVPSALLPMGETLAIEVEFESTTPLQLPALGIVISSVQGERILNVNNRYLRSPRFVPGVTAGRVRIELGPVPFTGNRYYVSFWMGDATQFLDTHVAENAMFFDVVEQDLWGTGKVPHAPASLLWWPAEYRMLPPVPGDNGEAAAAPAETEAAV
ncbi:MAG: ABC transporter ATP-binding protein [Planctomycetota bacterium]